MKAVNLVALLCLVFLTGFEIAGQTTETPKPAAENQKIIGTTEDDTDSTLKNRRNEKYRIGFQDTLEIIVVKHEELSLRAVNVNPDGTIMMPRIDRPIIAVCKTETELKKEIETLYKSYLRNPFVSVRAVEQRSQPFAVIGAVEKPGSFYLNRKIRLLELLAFAGGPDVEKAGSKIQIARVGNTFGCVENSELEADAVVFFDYKIRDVMDGKENPWMQPGDIVSVLDAEQAYVVGNVKKATKVSLKEPVTLTQAIAIAEGFDKTANTTKIIVQRQADGKQAKTELVYSLKDIRDRKIPDPYLQANDIVEVLTDNGKVVRKNILDLFKSIAPSAIIGL